MLLLKSWETVLCPTSHTQPTAAHCSESSLAVPKLLRHCQRADPAVWQLEAFPPRSTQINTKHTTEKYSWFLDLATVKDQLILYNKLQLPFLLFHSWVIFTEATRPHRSLEVNSRAIRAPQHVPQFVLSVVPAQYFITGVQCKKPGSLPFIVSLAINAWLIESISHEELRPFIWNQMPPGSTASHTNARWRVTLENAENAKSETMLLT